jgi:hypothetical protein
MDFISEMFRTMTTNLHAAIWTCVVTAALCGRSGPRSPWLLLMVMPSVLIGTAAIHDFRWDSWGVTAYICNVVDRTASPELHSHLLQAIAFLWIHALSAAALSFIIGVVAGLKSRREGLTTPRVELAVATIVLSAALAWGAMCSRFLMIERFGCFTILDRWLTGSAWGWTALSVVLLLFIGLRTVSPEMFTRRQATTP